MNQKPTPRGGLGRSGEEAGARALGIYVHVPWCSSRCGYCDFNTYVPGALAGVGPEQFVTDAVSELRIAARELAANASLGTASGGTAWGSGDGTRDQPADTVFFGGGTPTLLPAADLVAVLGAIRSEFGLAPEAEVTTEANPESVDQPYLAELRAGGFTRLSLGMQSAVPQVLRTLDRAHTPGRAVEAARWAREAGFAEVSLDLIYGTPGESDDDWRRSLDTALEAEPTHISAYSLIVEPGTRLARRVAGGEVAAPDEDVLAARYELADQAFAGAGLEWYEVSNWALGGLTGGSACRHNLGYWRSADWWGVGPGAHSHVAGLRWWNVKHPRTYSQALAEGRSPAADAERLTASDRRLEAVMLGLRLADGIDAGLVAGREDAVGDLVAEGLVDPDQARVGRVSLTLRGRLLADLVIRRLTG